MLVKLITSDNEKNHVCPLPYNNVDDFSEYSLNRKVQTVSLFIIIMLCKLEKGTFLTAYVSKILLFWYRVFYVKLMQNCTSYLISFECFN